MNEFEARKTVASVCGQPGSSEMDHETGRKWVAKWLRHGCAGRKVWDAALAEWSA